MRLLQNLLGHCPGGHHSSPEQPIHAQFPRFRATELSKYYPTPKESRCLTNNGLSANKSHTQLHEDLPNFLQTD
jgi:hypothetical protein